MRSSTSRRIVVSSIVTVCLVLGVASADPGGDVVTTRLDGSRISWSSQLPYTAAVLTVALPDGDTVDGLTDRADVLGARPAAAADKIQETAPGELGNDCSHVFQPFL